MANVARPVSTGSGSPVAALKEGHHGLIVERRAPRRGLALRLKVVVDQLAGAASQSLFQTTLSFELIDFAAAKGGSAG